MAGRQRGVVLMVVLVILLAVTLLGTVVMQGATLQTRMVANSQARQQAFNSAEATLAAAEQILAADTTSGAIKRANITAKFKSDCSGGFCFGGSLGVGSAPHQKDCTIGTPGTKEVWENTTLKVWETGGKHQPVTIPNMDKRGKYIVEFRCYIDGADKVAANEGDGLFRITAQGYSENGEASVMVQSTFRAYIPIL